jgi:excisionase family DNA binding protein
MEQHTTQSVERIYNVEQIAEILMCSYRRVLQLIKDGQLEAFKIGTNYRVTKSQLDKFMQGK